eukprot:m.85258 g.85258  ORF g.85258 m.85258 type:complete len:62 (-) comp25853_c0_seq2:150-335(-)
MSGIWCQPGTNQMETVKASIQQMSDGSQIATKVADLGDFYLAEGYHQKLSRVFGRCCLWLG